MKTSTSEYSEQTSFFTTLNNKDENELDVSDLKLTIEYCEKNSTDNICRILTLPDACQALNTLEIRQKLSRKRILSSNSDISSMLPEQKRQPTSEINCCHLVRSDKSSRFLLPLARRGRPHISSRSHHLLCKNCLKIKQKQQNDIFKSQYEFNLTDDETNSKNIFETITDLNKITENDNKNQMIEQDILHEIEFSLINENEKIHLNNSQYDTAQMLVWKINTSNNHNQINTIDTTYDTGSLTNNEKQILLQEAVQKLQIVLNNRSTSTTTIPVSDLDKIEFTYRALQTTVNILSSSLDSL